MDGRQFLRSARDLLAHPHQANWRSAAGRAYYALLHEARVAMERWGISLPPRGDMHSLVRLRFVYAAQPDVKQVGLDLEDLGRLRTRADYQLTVPGSFSTAARATQAVTSAETAIARLDAIEADPARRAAAIAALRAVGP